MRVVGDHPQVGEFGTVVYWVADPPETYQILVPSYGQHFNIEPHHIIPTFDVGDMVTPSESFQEAYPKSYQLLSGDPLEVVEVEPPLGALSQVLVASKRGGPWWVRNQNLIPVHAEHGTNPEKTHDCCCPTRTLMIRGCQCGGV